MGQRLMRSFEEYASEFFLNGYGNGLKPIIFNNKNAVLSRIKSDAREMASQYIKNNITRFPWEILMKFIKFASLRTRRE
ncbi:MAG: hypothetical protein AUI60_01250 [Thaumarchaeota archaeon 13_1_40CM_2_39_4]|nr:MAG: hypothetical protein AUI60_01250 [Thaumarchaeota archaeon 13_1_40CM_2_39_4]